MTPLFGVFLPPVADRLADVEEQARLADAAGLDLIGIQDHPYQRRFLDTWTLIGHLLARTSRIRIFPDVANLLLRPPAMMAKAAASLDVLSDGRFELGIGAGGFPDAVAAMGGARRTPGESVDALEEAIAILRAAWRAEGGLRHDGRHYQLDGYRPGPPPAHPIGIWVGAYRPRMLELTGRLADGWLPSLPYLPLDGIADAQRRIDEAARRAGRDPAAVLRLCNVLGTIGDSARGPFEGPPEHWVELLGELGERGFDGFVFGSREPSVEQIERFATEVVPAVREATG